MRHCTLNLSTIFLNPPIKMVIAIAGNINSSCFIFLYPLPHGSRSIFALNLCILYPVVHACNCGLLSHLITIRAVFLHRPSHDSFIAPLMVIERHRRDTRSRKNYQHDINGRKPNNTVCHYQGKIRNHANSKVALSACNGLVRSGLSWCLELKRTGK